MDSALLRLVEEQVVLGQRKWGEIDLTPVDFMIAVQEEIGEVAHAINHREGRDAIIIEIAQVIGLLSRLYEEVKDVPGMDQG